MVPVSSMAPLVIDERARGTTLMAVPGQVIEVHLPMSASSGFLWQGANHGIDVVRHEGLATATEVKPWDGRFGGDGVACYRLVATREGMEQVKLLHQRPFGDMEVADTFEFTVVVRALMSVDLPADGLAA